MDRREEPKGWRASATGLCNLVWGRMNIAIGILGSFKLGELTRPPGTLLYTYSLESVLYVATYDFGTPESNYGMCGNREAVNKQITNEEHISPRQLVIIISTADPL